MKEVLKAAKPILFNTEMVRAILEGRKTVTRRAIKNLPEDAEFGGWLLDSTCQEDAKDIGKAGFKTLKQQTEKAGCIFVRPPHAADDILYVRETWAKGYIESSDAECSNETWFEEWSPNCGEYINALTGYFYRADNEPKSLDIKWKPSIHMPKEAARIFLKVKSVRVERLQDIDDDGVVSEGLTIGDAFDELWNSTIKKKEMQQYGWEANPWVWVIEFERIEVE